LWLCMWIEGKCVDENKKTFAISKIEMISRFVL
jgi:hypothetical protein